MSLVQLIDTYDKVDDEYTKRMEVILVLTHQRPCNDVWRGYGIRRVALRHEATT